MPLAYNDIPGSWGTYSEGWPYIRCETEDESKRAFIACTKTNLVPYGSYVVVDEVRLPFGVRPSKPEHYVRHLRFETEELKARVVKFLAETPHKTYDALREHFISTGAWSK